MILMLYITRRVIGVIFSFMKVDVMTEEKGCQYSLRDVIMCEKERRILEAEYYEAFDSLTITSARRYLSQRGFSSPLRKHDVNKACVKLRLLEIMDGSDVREGFGFILKGKGAGSGSCGRAPRSS